MISIAEAVEHAHEHQIFHRDLKPANIMLRKNMDPVVMDFGLAKMNYGQESNEMSLSMSGQIIGTIEYMAPEQAKSSKTVDQRADIYSLGAILYQMLTGEKHFKSSGNILTDAIGLERHTPRRPKEWNPMISADLETITMKALRPDPNDRYQTIQSFLQDLQAVSNGSRIEARDLFLTELLWRWAKNNKTISSLSVLFIFLLTLSLIIFVVNLNAEKTKAQKALSYLKQEQLARENLSHEAAPRFLLEARAHLQANDFEKANISLNIASNLNRDLAEAKWLQACFHIIHKRFQEATSILKNIHKHKNSEKLHSLSRQLSIDSANDQLWAQVQDILIKENEFRLAERINSDREKLFEIWKLRIEQEYQAELKESRGLLSLSLSQIQSLNAIKGIPIEDLTIANSPALSDISSLSGLPLIKLTLKDTNVSDLSAISTAPLKELILLRCKVEKLTASISWNLSHLIINDCPIQSLDSFKDQPLFFLELGNISMENLEFISKMQLNHLIVNNLPIHDLSPITNLPLEHLRLEEIPANDISSLSSLTLKSLMLKQMKISSLEPLKNMKLESLNLEHSQFDHLSVIKHMKLQDIDLDHTNVKDIAFLKDMPIVTIDLENTNIDNIDVLRGMELKSLDLDRLPIKNIDLVKGMPLEALDIERTLVDNLEPLRGLPLKHLDMGDCDATDLEPLNNMPLEELYLHRHYLNDGNRKFKNLQVIKSLKNLKLLSINMKSLSQEDQEMLRSIPGLKIIF
jgi:serine/threonine protein kinase